MLTLSLLIASLVAAPQAPTKSSPASPACGALSSQEVGSLIGTATRLPVMSSGTGSSCMFQNGDKMITVLVVFLSSEDAAKGQWDAQKRIASGKDVVGWPAQAFSAAIERPKEHVAVVGIRKGTTFVEVKVLDKTQPAAAMETKLQAVMKALSGRL